MAGSANLNVRLSNGSERVVALGDVYEDPETLMDEILTRQNDYEWIEDSDGRMLRVEAIDEMWVA